MQGAQLLWEIDQSARQRESVQTEALAAAVAEQLSRVPQLQGENLSGQILQDAQRRVESSSITVDLSQVVPGKEPLVVPYSKDLTVDSLLDQVYFSLSNAVKPFTYNDAWVLADEQGAELTQIGTRWARAHGLRRDARTLEKVGIYPGIRLSAVVKSADGQKIPRPSADEQQWRRDLKHLMDLAADDATGHQWQVRRISGQQRPRLVARSGDGTNQFGLYGMPGPADRVQWVKLARDACLALSQDEGAQIWPVLLVNAMPSPEVQKAAKHAGVLLVWYDGNQFHNAPWHNAVTPGYISPNPNES